MFSPENSRTYRKSFVEAQDEKYTALFLLKRDFLNDKFYLFSSSKTLFWSKDPLQKACPRFQLGKIYQYRSVANH
jgi:hypothetical protein